MLIHSPDSKFSISALKTEEAGRPEIWMQQSACLFHDVQRRAGSFHRHQKDSGSFFQKGWALRLYNVCPAFQVHVCLLEQGGWKTWSLRFIELTIQNSASFMIKTAASMERFVKWDDFLLSFPSILQFQRSVWESHKSRFANGELVISLLLLLLSILQWAA